jgi:hypothetical protein
MPWFMGAEAEEGLGFVFRLQERLPARSVLVPGINSGSGERVLDCTPNQRKTRYNIQDPELWQGQQISLYCLVLDVQRFEIQRKG